MASLSDANLKAWVRGMTSWYLREFGYRAVREDLQSVEAELLGGADGSSATKHEETDVIPTSSNAGSCPSSPRGSVDYMPYE